MSLEHLESEHVGMVVWILDVRGAEKDKDVRGYEAQRERREMERAVRIRAVTLAERLRASGQSRTRVARRLGVSSGSLAGWERRRREDGLRPRPRGRSIEPLGKARRAEIRDVLDLLGPFEGLPVLQKLFPDVPRAELEHQLRRYRREFVANNHVDVHALSWLRAGAVWTMDFNVPPRPIDNIFGHIFEVRDLGSGNALTWLPTDNEGSRGVCQTLEVLFRTYGAPLVLKEDNGSPFRSQALLDLLEKWGVEFLMSPPYYPQYNGSAEAGIGTLETYAHHEAARNDRPGEWSCDDVEAARLKSNELSRPRGLRGPTPDELWQSRVPIHPIERAEFRKLVRERYQHNLDEVYQDKCAEPDKTEQAAARRQAVAWALSKFGILSIKRRRISPPIKSKFWSRIM